MRGNDLNPGTFMSKFSHCKLKLFVFPFFNSMLIFWKQASLFIFVFNHSLLWYSSHSFLCIWPYWFGRNWKTNIKLNEIKAEEEQPPPVVQVSNLVILSLSGQGKEVGYTPLSVVVRCRVSNKRRPFSKLKNISDLLRKDKEGKINENID